MFDFKIINWREVGGRRWRIAGGFGAGLSYNPTQVSQVRIHKKHGSRLEVLVWTGTGPDQPDRTGQRLVK